MIRGLDHLVLTVRELAVSLHFYCEVLGMQEQRFGDGRVAARFGAQKINFHVAGAEFDPHASRPEPGSADICLLVEGSLDDWRQRLQEHAVKLHAGPVLRTGAVGPLQSIYVHDPDGNLIELAVEAPVVPLEARSLPGIEFRRARASAEEAQACLEIYRPSVEQSHHSFELQLPSVEEFQGRMATAMNSHTWWLAYRGTELWGYAYSNAHRERTAYQQACEVSAYVAPVAQRSGIASQLYARCFDDLKALGKTVAYAIIALPHSGSVAFHESLGFRPIAHFPQAGRKFDQAWDVGWWRRPLH